MRNGTWIFCLSVFPFLEKSPLIFPSLWSVKGGVLDRGNRVTPSWLLKTLVPYSFRHPPPLSMTLLVVPFSTSSQGSLSSSSFNCFLNNCRNRPCEWKFHRYPSSSSCTSSSVGQTGRHLETDEAIIADQSVWREWERGTHPLQGLIKRIKRPLGRV